PWRRRSARARGRRTAARTRRVRQRTAICGDAWIAPFLEVPTFERDTGCIEQGARDRRVDGQSAPRHDARPEIVLARHHAEGTESGRSDEGELDDAADDGDGQGDEQRTPQIAEGRREENREAEEHGAADEDADPVDERGRERIALAN